jgi:hypothetical protein
MGISYEPKTFFGLEGVRRVGTVCGIIGTVFTIYSHYNPTAPDTIEKIVS